MTKRPSSPNQTLPDVARDRLIALYEPVRGAPKLEMREQKEEVHAYMCALHLKGLWSLQSIAEVCGISRERVRQCVELALSRNVAYEYIDVPIYVKPEKVREYARPRPELSREQVRKLQRLQSVAKNLRGAVGMTPERKASEELAQYLNELTKEGYWVADIARILGVKPITVRARMRRFGYRHLPPSQKPYQGAPKAG